jgi:hypothetical protein
MVGCNQNREEKSTNGKRLSSRLQMSNKVRVPPAEASSYHYEILHVAPYPVDFEKQLSARFE